jgi:hypothetical protein
MPNLTDEQFKSLIEARVVGSAPAAGLILKWIAGIVGGVLTTVLCATLFYVASSLKNHDDDISNLQSRVDTDRQLRAQSDLAFKAQLDRIEANTGDRITRNETMREFRDVREDMEDTRELATRSMEMLVDRSTFITTTTTTLEQLNLRMAALEDQQQ